MKTFVVITLCIAIVINIIVGNMYAFDFQGYFDRVNEVTNFSLMKRLYPVWNNNENKSKPKHYTLPQSK